MKIAVIETSFLEPHIKKLFSELQVPGELSFYNYDSFANVGPLYTALCSRYDGFLISGPLPLAAVKRYVKNLPKPIIAFGTDAIGYYETFFKAQYEQNDMYFEKGYFDLMDMNPKSFSLYEALRDGTFWQHMNDCFSYTSKFNLNEFAALESRITQKHISLFKNGNTAYSVTRLSSIMPSLLEAGVPTYFVYPSKQLLQNALNELVTSIHLTNMIHAQNALMHINDQSPFGSLRTGGMLLRNEGSALDISCRSGVSANTIAKLLDVINRLGSNQMTSKTLAAAMNINVRSANRILAKLTETELASIVSEQMIARKGRPERIYRLFQDYL